MILKTISSELQSKAEDSEADTYSEKAEKFDNEVIEGDSRQAPLTHEEVHAVMNRFAMTNAAGEPQDPSTLPQTTGSNKPQETRLERAIESASLINEARRRGATDMELLACVRTAVSKNGLFEPFIYENEHFTKTGSGQTQGKHSTKGPFFLR